MDSTTWVIINVEEFVTNDYQRTRNGNKKGNKSNQWRYKWQETWPRCGNAKDCDGPLDEKASTMKVTLIQANAPCKKKNKTCESSK